MSLYDTNGNIRLTAVDGSTKTGAYASDGSLYIVLNDGTTWVGGRYHVCGAMNAVLANGSTYTEASNGSVYVNSDGSGGYTFNTPVGTVVPPWVLKGVGVQANIDMDFANSRYYGGTLSSLLSCSRASSGYATNADGTLTLFPSNTPRIGVGTGLLVEEARTNSIKTSDMTGAVLGVMGSGGALPNNWTRDVDGGLTYTIVGKGASDIGEPYIDIRISGTSTGTFTNILFESSTGIAAANGQTWSLSAYLKLVAGSTANLSSYTLGIFERGAGGSFLAQSNSGSLLPATTYRQSVTRVFNNASTQFTNGAFGLSYNVGAAIDVTFRIGLPQQEQGAFVTSPILTTTVPVLRGADNVNGTSALLAAYATTGTFYVEGISTPSGLGGWAAYNDNSATNRIDIRSNQGSLINTLITVGGVGQYNASSGTITNNLACKTAIAWTTGDANAVINGTLAAPGTPASLPATASITTMWIGNFDNGSSFYLNNYIKRLSVWKGSRLPNATLQTLTA